MENWVIFPPNSLTSHKTGGCGTPAVEGSGVSGMRQCSAANSDEGTGRERRGLKSPQLCLQKQLRCIRFTCKACSPCTVSGLCAVGELLKWFPHLFMCFLSPFVPTCLLWKIHQANCQVGSSWCLMWLLGGTVVGNEVHRLWVTCDEWSN